jgi:hypothetical protein
MPLTTYTAGDVLTAASLNANFSFAASNPPGGLTFITGAAFTTVTSFSLPNDTFTATYDYYKLVVSITAVTADSTFTMRMRASGTDNTASEYHSMFIGITDGNVASNGVGVSATSFNVGEQDVIARYALSLDIINPFVSGAVTSLHGQYTFLNRAANANTARAGGAFQRATTQFDSLSFISSVASSITGSYKVYGYANS